MRQRQRDLSIGQPGREEIEKQNEATLHLAKQKQQLELEQLRTGTAEFTEIANFES